MLTMIPSVNADMIDHHHNKQPYDAGVLDYSDAGSIYGGIVYSDSNGMQSYEEDIYSSSPISQVRFWFIFGFKALKVLKVFTALQSLFSVTALWSDRKSVPAIFFIVVQAQPSKPQPQ